MSDGRTYVGQHVYDDSKDPANDRYMGSGLHVNNAMKKYGKDAFKKEIVESGILTQKEASTKEIAAILAEKAIGHGEFNHSLAFFTGKFISAENEAERRRRISQNSRSKELALARDDPIVCLETGRVYKNTSELFEEEHDKRLSNVKRAVKNGTTCAGRHWAKYEEGLDFESLLETLKARSEERRRLGREITSEKQSRLRGEKYYMKGYRFYTNDESETRCLPEDAPVGWHVGRSDIWKKKHSRPKKGTRHVKCLETNGGVRVAFVCRYKISWNIPRVEVR